MWLVWDLIATVHWSSLVQCNEYAAPGQGSGFRINSQIQHGIVYHCIYIQDSPEFLIKQVTLLWKTINGTGLTDCDLTNVMVRHYPIGGSNSIRLIHYSQWPGISGIRRNREVGCKRFLAVLCWRFCADVSVLAFLSGRFSPDVSAWTFCRDVCVWTFRSGRVCLDLCPGRFCLDVCVWEFLSGCLCQDVCVWTLRSGRFYLDVACDRRLTKGRLWLMPQCEKCVRHIHVHNSLIYCCQNEDNLRCQN